MASSAVDTRTEGIIPTCSIRLCTSFLFTDSAPSEMALLLLEKAFENAQAFSRPLSAEGRLNKANRECIKILPPRAAPRLAKENSECRFVPQKSWQVSGAHGFPQLLESEQIRCKSLAVSEFRGAITAFRVQKIEQGETPGVIGVIGDVPGLFGDVTVLILVH